tara:strand:+ start:25454 stop:26002 length:549 start_codon:yes stop_codon:yes gene_type:complete
MLSTYSLIVENQDLFSAQIAQEVFGDVIAGNNPNQVIVITDTSLRRKELTSNAFTCLGGFGLFASFLDLDRSFLEKDAARPALVACANHVASGYDFIKAGLTNFYFIAPPRWTTLYEQSKLEAHLVSKNSMLLHLMSKLDRPSVFDFEDISLTIVCKDKRVYDIVKKWVDDKKYILSSKGEL